MYSCRLRTVSPPSDRKTTCWFSAIPCDFSNSHKRRRGFSSKVWTKLKHLLDGFCSSSLRLNSSTLLPAITSKNPILCADRTYPPSIPTVIGPSGVGCCSQSSSVPSNRTGYPTDLNSRDRRCFCYCPRVTSSEPVPH